MLTERVRNIVGIIDFNRSYVIFKEFRRSNVLIGKCEWTDKTKYKQRIYKKINKKLILASEQTLQEMESEKAIYGKLYYHFNNFCSL